MPLPVILIFDVGKTNKKVLLFDKQHHLVFEEAIQLPETTDEDGFPCEDVAALTTWLQSSLCRLLNDKRFAILAVNASAYGASFVHLNNNRQPFLPLYNYLKPVDEELSKRFYKTHGDVYTLAKETASPMLGNLNSGMQLYWLKYKKPKAYADILYSLHLPQYISFVVSNCLCSDVTSIGCHTMLWDFTKHTYHDWIYKEELDKKLAPIISCTKSAGTINSSIPVGCGLHDSSAALLPYTASFQQPFVLLSTGTWNISINPFNQTPLTIDELNADCLNYLSSEGKSIKASRIFAGYEHEQQIKKLAAHFNKMEDYFKTLPFDASLCRHFQQPANYNRDVTMVGKSLFALRNLHDFATCNEAYHQLIMDIIHQQVLSTRLVMEKDQVKQIFVDGGFSKNEIYMNLLATAFPDIEVNSAIVAQASALGAAVAISKLWNDLPLPSDLIAVKRYYHSHLMTL